MSVSVAAPGKAMLIGEYAVLDGGPAVVAAVDCYAVARLPPPYGNGQPSSPFIAAARRHAREALSRLAPGADPAVEAPLVDTASFTQGGRKLGVGSSAAATVAAVGAIFAAAGLDPAAYHGEIVRCAAAAHDQAQGVRGSGADILASTFGGICTLPRKDAHPSRAEPPLPVRLRFVATSTSASTAALVSRYRTGGEGASIAGLAMASAATAFLAAWRDLDSAALLRAVEESFEAYLGLGFAIHQALITPDHAEVHAAARKVGGAAKPSGAGGGDLAVAFLPDMDAERAFLAALPPHLSPLSLRVSATGVHDLRRTQ